jgi:hypothetical protein
MRIVKELLLNPVEAIKKAKTKKEINKISSLFIVEWLLIGIANVIIYANLGKLTMIGIGLAVFLIGIPLALFLAFLLSVIIKILGGRGNFYSALTAIVYGMFAISIGFLVSSPFFYVPKIGFIFSLFILVISVALSLATFYRSIKELFNVDIITTWIGLGLTVAAITFGVYLTFILLFGGTQGFLQMFSTLRTWNI